MFISWFVIYLWVAIVALALVAVAGALRIALRWEQRALAARDSYLHAVSHVAVAAHCPPETYEEGVRPMLRHYLDSIGAQVEVEAGPAFTDDNSISRLGVH